MNEVVVPLLVSELEEKLKPAMLANAAVFISTVSQLFHAQGVNLWQMGEVRNHCQSKVTRDLLLQVMAARTLKCLIQKWFRVAAEKRISQSTLACYVLRWCFHPKSEEFWTQVLIPSTQVSWLASGWLVDC